MKLPHSPGVYLLTHRKTRDTYVGSCKSLLKRVSEQLRLGCQTSLGVRECAAANGDDFRFRILELTTIANRLAAEKRWIDKLKPTLNRCVLHCTTVSDLKKSQPLDRVLLSMFIPISLKRRFRIWLIKNKTTATDHLTAYIRRTLRGGPPAKHRR